MKTNSKVNIAPARTKAVEARARMPCNVVGLDRINQATQKELRQAKRKKIIVVTPTTPVNSEFTRISDMPPHTPEKCAMVPAE